jgi:DNA-binding NarL/FixJ family response regulator
MMTERQEPPSLEQRIAELRDQGLDDAAIRARLHISQSTLDAVTDRILTKRPGRPHSGGRPVADDG